MWISKEGWAKFQKELSDKTELLNICNKENSIRRSLPVLDYNTGDPSPSDQEERKSYVGRVAGIFQDIFIKKIQHMIAEQQRELSNPTHSHEQDVFIKANINALSLLLDYGDECINEHISNNNKENNGEI